MRKRLLRLTFISLSAVLLGLGALTGCQGKLIYFPRPYPAGDVTRWSGEPGAKIIDYRTDDGPQQAYLLSPTPTPQHLWLVCGGNGTLALEWSDWIRRHAPPGDAWLMIDMPGYGACHGSPSPASIRRSLRAVVPAAAESLGWSLPNERHRLRIFGHSLGSAVCLMAAREYDIRRGVLLTPFTSTMEMAREVTGLPVGALVWHRFDNTARLREIEAAGSGKIFIFHGTDDEIIPVKMAHALGAAAPNTIRLSEIPGGRHNTLQEMIPARIAKALEDAR